MSRGRGGTTSSRGGYNSYDDFADEYHPRNTTYGGRSRNDNNDYVYRDEIPPRSRFDQNPLNGGRIPPQGDRQMRTYEGRLNYSRDADNYGNNQRYNGINRASDLENGYSDRYQERRQGEYPDQYSSRPNRRSDFSSSRSEHDFQGSSRTYGGPQGQQYNKDSRDTPYSRVYDDRPNSGRGGFSDSRRTFDNQTESGSNSVRYHGNYSSHRDNSGFSNGSSAPLSRSSFSSEDISRNPGFLGTSGRGGLSRSSREGQSTFNSPNQKSPAPNSSYGRFSRAPEANFRSGNVTNSQSNQENHNENARAPRDYKPEFRKVRDIFQEDRDLANRDSSRMDEDADIEVSETTGQDIAMCERWEEMELHPILLENIKKSGYNRPRKVQQYTIPYVLDDYDCKVQCETGSGKTAAFLIPIINFLIHHQEDGYRFAPCCPVALIVAPTRELVNQLYDQASKFVTNTGISVARVYGEYNMRDNSQEIRRGCNIIIACLGRLMHFIREGTIALGSVRYIVLDEADRLMTENSNQEIMELLRWRTLPDKEKRQTLLFSATLEDPAVLRLSSQFLKNNKVVRIKANTTSNKRLRYEIYNVDDTPSKHKKIAEYIRNISSNKSPRVLIFVNKKIDTERVAAKLTTEGFKATTIHGDRGQHLREEAMKSFRSGNVKILVATDVCARGVDIKDLDYVINFDLPNDISTFIQRCGRTGRTHEGTAVSFYYEPENRHMAQEIAKIMDSSQQPVPRFLLNGLYGEDFHNEENSESYNDAENVEKDLQDLTINDGDAGWD